MTNSTTTIKGLISTISSDSRIADVRVEKHHDNTFTLRHDNPMTLMVAVCTAIDGGATFISGSGHAATLRCPA